MSNLRRIIATLAALTSTAGFSLATAPIASATTGADRVGYLVQSGDLFIQEGPLAAGDLQESSVGSFQMEGDRVLVLTSAGDLLVKEGDLGPGWHTVATGVTSAELDGDHIGYTDATGLYVVHGDLYGEPVKEYDGQVPRWQIEGDRIAVLAQYRLLVKDGDSDWVSMAPGKTVTNFQLHGDRVAYIVAAHKDSFLYATEGELDTPAQMQTNHVRRFQLSGDRLAVLTGDTLLIKQGDLGPGWYTVDTNAGLRFQLDGDRIAYEKDADLWVAEGAIDAEPRLVIPEVGEFEISGDRIAESDDAGFRVKEGALDADWVTISTQPARSFQIGTDYNRSVKSYYW